MLTFDIPVNIKLTANTEEEAEQLVAGYMEHMLDGSALTRPFIAWDFIVFVEDDEPDSEFFMGS